MATTPLRLWIAAEANSLLSGPSSFVGANAPSFYAGNTTPLELHLISGAGISRTPFEVPFPAGATIKVAVGSVNAYPTAGQWRLSVDSTETTDLAYNASAAVIQSALNALSAVSSEGGVTVTDIGEGYSITWNTVGVKPEILPGSNTLTPSSYQAITIVQAGGVSTREVRMVELRQNPVALTSVFSPIGTPAISVSTVSAWNGTNKVVRYEIDPQPNSGNYTVTVNSKTAAISSNAGDSEILVAFGTAGATEVQAINRVGPLSFDLILSSDVAVTANASGLIASYGYKGEISFATTEVIEFLGGAEKKQSTLEITFTVDDVPRTLVQSSCTIYASVVSPGALEPVPMGTVLTEEVANTRFIRKDIVDAPSTATQDILWQNLGLTTDGSDTVAAMNSAEGASAGNEFLTSSAGNARYATIGSNPFNQSLNTTDSVEFNSITTTGYVFGTSLTGINIVANGAKVRVSDPIAGKVTEYAGTGITFQDATFQDSAFIPADYLSVTTAASTYATIASLSSYLTTATAASTYLTITTASSTYALLSSFDQSLKTTDGVQFGGGGFYVGDGVLSTTVGLGNGWTLGIQGAGLDTTLSWDGLTIAGTTGITFADGTIQNTRVVREDQSNASGYTNAGFYTHYPKEIKVIDHTGVAYWVPARLA